MDKGADVASRDIRLKTGLHYAVDSGNYELVSVLVEKRKALIRAKDENNQTPLHYAARFGHFKVSTLFQKLVVSRNLKTLIYNEYFKWNDIDLGHNSSTDA